MSAPPPTQFDKCLQRVTKDCKTGYGHGDPGKELACIGVLGAACAMSSAFIELAKNAGARSR